MSWLTLVNLSFCSSYQQEWLDNDIETEMHLKGEGENWSNSHISLKNI